MTLNVLECSKNLYNIIFGQDQYFTLCEQSRHVVWKVGGESLLELKTQEC